MNTEIKRHIDSARQVLVGVVPNPTSQIDQITTALIYKFMDDMDQSAIKVGGDPSFFTGELEKYSWTKLMDTRIGNQERMNLYVEALSHFAESKKLPELFRGIFKSAFLPYRSPDTLGLFLKEINYFDYSHPEDLGDAYEYLLSIMSSQGDAGQFRTPRHIIDFMVDVVDPDKDDRILDPACGTAGFLIKSYLHILEKHDGKDDPEHKEKPLTPDERRKLLDNFEGYDIDPGMVRIAQVNMYLHQFKNPKIFQYDSLTQEDRWNDKFDVILANPPFMSPKGGIKPHQKFSIQSSRSEVLFVDYIMNHLKPRGRAAIIVPEGIIFQSGTAYKQLRKNLVDDGLYGVVSLPSGIFNPYAGVKTSILLFNNEIAKQKKEILFVKVENDGYDLGATKRQIDKNDLPQALDILDKWRIGEKVESKLVVYVEKTIIAESGDYNLSGDRYLTRDIVENKWEMVALGDKSLFIIESGGTPDTKNSEYWKGNINWITLADLPQEDFVTTVISSIRKISELGLKNSSAKILPRETILVSTRATIGRIGITGTELATNQGFKNIIVKDKKRVHPKYIAYVMTSMTDQLNSLASGGTFKEVSKSNFEKIRIPLPPFEAQEQIVKEIDGYQKIIDGARQVVNNWKPRIKINPEWKKVRLPSITTNFDSKRKPVTKSDRKSGKYPYYGASGIVDYVDDYIFDGDYLLISEDGANLIARNTDIAFSISGKNWVNNHAHILKFNNIYTQKFVEIYINQINIKEYVTGMAQPKLNQEALNSIEIPIPDIEIQQKIVEKLEMEKELIDSAYRLINIYTEKSTSLVSNLWNQ